jgi:pantothenate kinase-related protein Tda10
MSMTVTPKPDPERYPLPQFDKLAVGLHDELHEKCSLVNLEGKFIGFSPEDSVPILAAALKSAYLTAQSVTRERYQQTINELTERIKHLERVQ